MLFMSKQSTGACLPVVPKAGTMPCLFQSIEPQHSDVKELCMFENLALLEPCMSIQNIFLEDGHVVHKILDCCA